MRRWFRYPVLTAALVAMWLLLQQSMAPGQWVIGILVALVACRAMAALQPQEVRFRWSLAIPKLFGVVLTDIFRSNVAVGRIILSRKMRPRRSGFMMIPLDMTNPHGLAMLALIMTATPGTLWVQHDAARGVLIMHVLDLIDESDWVTLIKGRYERLLMEIFI
ncbi:Na+/H+ antiporter subunit E [Segnochrobactraceae bacterium EtOH-i3]